MLLIKDLLLGYTLDIHISQMDDAVAGLRKNEHSVLFVISSVYANLTEEEAEAITDDDVDYTPDEMVNKEYMVYNVDTEDEIFELIQLIEKYKEHKGITFKHDYFILYTEEDNKVSKFNM